jgi:hypothetical protein
MFLKDDLHLLAQARGTGFLIGERVRFYSFYLHDGNLDSSKGFKGIVLNPTPSAMVSEASEQHFGEDNEGCQSG